MVHVRLLSNGGSIARYSYQPEKAGEEGILSYDFANDGAVVEKLAENDGKSSFYRAPVVHMIREAGISNLPNEKTLVWY